MGGRVSIGEKQQSPTTSTRYPLIRIIFTSSGNTSTSNFSKIFNFPCELFRFDINGHSSFIIGISIINIINFRI